ncbi:MAG: hypothetical protein S4CHLAM7_04340 [Chlamydiae bacterium]|nr:hypothetical protein [Chlamydiota bacterium]
MNKIQIKNKLKPFSTRPGIEIPFPISKHIFKIYPTVLEIINEQDLLLKVELFFKEPPNQFISFFNLVKNRVEVELSFDKGVVHYHLRIKENKLFFQVKRCGFKSFVLKMEGKEKKSLKMHINQECVLVEEIDQKSPENSLEILSLGSHKKQQIEPLLERKDPKEILPLVFLMGQLGSFERTKHLEGSLNCIKTLQKNRRQKNHDQLLPDLLPVFNQSFSGLLAPYLEDINFWKPTPSKFTKPRASRFSLLSELYFEIRHFFLTRTKNELFILPHLPPECYCGRLVNVEESGLTLQMDWSKKLLKMLHIYSAKEHTIKLVFQSPIQKCRVRVDNTTLVFKNKSSFTFEKSKTYFFDRFEK